MNYLHEFAWIAAGDTAVRTATARAWQIKPAGLRLVLAVAAIEERSRQSVGIGAARLLSGMDPATVSYQATKLGPNGTGLLSRDGRTKLRLTPTGRDLANDFGRRMRRHLEGVDEKMQLT